MRAVGIEKFGDRSELKVLSLPRPVPAANEVLISVKAAGVNPVDSKIRQGYLKDLFPHHFPVVLGWDAAGIVAEVGSAVTKFKVGDEVFAYCRKPEVQWGAYAELVTVPESSIALRPRNTTFEESAAIPLAALTAYQVLLEGAKIVPGNKVLIHAAAGGVGVFAVQMAVNAGAEVVGTCSSRNREFVSRLGAKHVVDYSKVDFVSAVRSIYPDGVDVVIDCVGGDVQLKSARVLKNNGRLITIVRSPEQEKQLPSNITYVHVFVRPCGEQLAEIANMVESVKLKTFVTNTFTLAEAAQAQELVDTGHVRGKVVLKVAA